MYRKILMALENGAADGPLIAHVSELASQVRAELLLVHVADGFAARNFEQLKLAESEEMKRDRAYLEGEAEKLRARGLVVKIHLALGDPSRGIVKAAEAVGCDLIAMGGHGHRLIGDIIHGSTVHSVRHETTIPVLIVRTKKE
jgi:manganese transport protein